MMQLCILNNKDSRSFTFVNKNLFLWLSAAQRNLSPTINRIYDFPYLFNILTP